MSREFASAYLDALAKHLCDPSCSFEVGGYLGVEVVETAAL